MCAANKHAAVKDVLLSNGIQVEFYGMNIRYDLTQTNTNEIALIVQNVNLAIAEADLPPMKLLAIEKYVDIETDVI